MRSYGVAVARDGVDLLLLLDCLDVVVVSIATLSQWKDLQPSQRKKGTLEKKGKTNHRTNPTTRERSTFARDDRFVARA